MGCICAKYALEWERTMHVSLGFQYISVIVNYSNHGNETMSRTCDNNIRAVKIPSLESPRVFHADKV